MAHTRVLTGGISMGAGRVAIGTPKVSEPGFWKFWIAEKVGSVMRPTGKEVILRIPPQSIEIHRPIRAQVNQDLSRNAVVVVDGLGLVRWTLSGTHGSGMNDIQAVSPYGQISAGLKARFELNTLFESWAKENVERAQSTEPLLRLVLTISDGGPSELPFDEWEIVPDEIPRDRRTSAQPFAWNWSIGFWGVEHLSDSPKDGGRDFLLEDQAEVLKKADKDLEDVEKKLTKPSFLDKLFKFLAKVMKVVKWIRALRDAIKTAIAAGKKIFHSIVDMAVGLVQSITGILDDLQVAFRDERDYVRGVGRELRDQLLKTRFVAGNLTRAAKRPFDRSMPNVYPVARPTALPVQPGDSVQSLAARTFGDASRWLELVDLNGLDYPYLDFTGPNMTPDPALLAAGRRVLGSGDALSLPLVNGLEVPPDPIGWDRDESGSMSVLTGKDNLSAAILRRLRTPSAWLPYHLDYGAGLNRHIGGTLTLSGVLSLRRDVVASLLLDPRVLRVLSARAWADVDALYVDAEVDTPLGLLQVSGPLSPA